ncbi:MAG: UvrB/UvrC motif-containing protein [Phycisphaerae bacterium]|nr:UvrB/UvrC motif-containing protein [Phycisphaerae bacterium]
MKNLPEEIFDNCLTLQSDSGQAIEKPGELPTSAGLILFADNQNLPILLLSAANIRRTVKNKLAEQKETTKKADLKSITAKIYYETCPCKFRLSLEHYKAAKKIFALNYKDHISFVYPWFIEIDLNEKTPFFSITRKPGLKKTKKILGPFCSQKSAAVFLNTLEDAFKLCKRNDLLRQAQSRLVGNPQRAAGCPYLQMDACSGVCDGKIRPQEYQNIIKDAFEAGAEPAKQIEKLQVDMQRAAKDLNFELAAELKKKIEKLSALKKQIYPHTNSSSIRTCSKSSAKISAQHSQTNRHSGKIGVGVYRWTGDLEKLKIIHIDKSAKIKPFDLVRLCSPQAAQGKPQKGKKKIQTYAVFVMNFFEVIDVGDFVIDDFEKSIGAIENALLKLNSNQQENCDPSTWFDSFDFTQDKYAHHKPLRASSTELIERFSIVSYFLYRTKPAGLWIDASGGVDRHGLTRSFLNTD